MEAEPEPDLRVVVTVCANEKGDARPEKTKRRKRNDERARIHDFVL
jgi:hypothetical protein